MQRERLCGPVMSRASVPRPAEAGSFVRVLPALALIAASTAAFEAAALPVSFEFGVRLEYLDQNEAPGSAYNQILTGASLFDQGTVEVTFDTADVAVASATATYVVLDVPLSARMTLPTGSQSEGLGVPSILIEDGSVDVLSISFFDHNDIGAGFHLEDPTGAAVSAADVADPIGFLLALDATSFTTGSWYADAECCSAGAGSIFAVPEPSSACLTAIGLAVLARRARKRERSV